MPQCKSKYIIPKIAIPIILIVLMIVSLGVYANSMSEELKKEALNRLKEIAQSNRVVVYSALDDKQQALKQMASFIRSRDIYIDSENIDLLKEVSLTNHFDKIGIISPNDEVFIVDSGGAKTVKLKNTQGYFERALLDKKQIISVGADKTGDKALLVFKTSLDRDGKINNILFAASYIEHLKNYITLDIFNGNGYSVIIDKNGNKIIESNNAILVPHDTNNVVKNIQLVKGIDSELVQNFADDLQHDRVGLLKFDSRTSEGEIYCYYQPLGLDDLYLLTIIPAKFIDDKYNMFIDTIYYLFTILCSIIILILASIIFLERKKQKDLSKILFKDEITNGYSYAKFYKEVSAWLKKDGYKNKAFISLDIDNFKIINDVFGYQTGNKLLQKIFDILNKSINTNGFFSREYADNFVIIVKYETNRDIVKFVELLLKEIKEINLVQEDKYVLVPSMGIYILNERHESIEEMKNNAMMARRIVKNKYNTLYNFYYDGIKRSIIEKKNILDNIYKGLDKREFVPYFQPKYDTKTRKIISSEALIRWIKPDGTMIPPVKFIPVAEELGIIGKIDEYMFEAICRQQSIWREKGVKVCPISVNISRNKLYEQGFIDNCLAVMKSYEVTTDDIQIEITEGSLVKESKVGRNIINKLRDNGFEVLIDDFGTGFSSISMIRNISATKLKIDKSFVDDNTDKGKQMLCHIIGMGKTMNMKTIAEGVETKEQYEFLLKHGCDAIQGYYFAKPMPADMYEEYLNAQS